jgi:hypothetical protein
MRYPVIALFLFFSITGRAQKPVTDTSGLSGTWKGSSVCQVKSSSCSSETVIYHIARTEKPNQYGIQMNKIVNGKEEDMAWIPATYDPATHKLTGTMNNYKAWHFTVKGKRIDGTLLLEDGTLYRVIHVARE